MKIPVWPAVCLLMASSFSETTGNGSELPPPYWVFFAGKSGVAEEDLRAEGGVSVRAVLRRRKQGAAEIDGYDRPVSGAYLARLDALGLTPRVSSRWMNAVSVSIPDSLLETVRSFSFVRSVRRVASFSVSPSPQGYGERATAKQSRGHALDYGESFGQNHLIRVPDVHDLGITGKGVLVGVIDTGFDYRNRPVFSALDVVDEYDFYNDDPVTANQEGDAANQHNHGTEVLSAIGGFEEGQLIGTSYGASFALAKTEFVPVTDYAVEEDYWIAAIEWLENIGADIVTSSLVYSTFVDRESYTYEELDGNTSLISRAADIAAFKGVVVLNSAGNRDVWPHVEFPADGDSVIAVGAVTGGGVQAWFSAEGPTADGRIKPDVMAMGVGVRVVYPPAQDVYQYRNGTSYSSPQVAGVCALVLEAHPELSAMQVRDALRNTADRSEAPDNRYGWGLVNAYEAIFHHGMIFTRFERIESPLDGLHTLEMDVFARDGVEGDAVRLYYTDDDGTLQWTQAAPVDPATSPRFRCGIPGVSSDTLRFYVEARDASGVRHAGPIGAPDRMYSIGSGGGNGIDIVPNVPQNLVLWQNFPNPFNQSTTIRLELIRDTRVLLRVFDRTGREVTVLYDGMMSRGHKRFEWDGCNAAGYPVSSGVYFCTLRTNETSRTIKMIHVR